MLYPNEIQAALLYDRKLNCLMEVVRNFQRLAVSKLGMEFNVPEANPGLFYRLYGANSMTITFEYLDQPANMALFEPALRSSITGILCPDVRQRLHQNRSMILINVSHGVFGNSPEIHRLLAQLDFPKEGHSLPQFRQRLDVCGMAARVTCDQETPQLVHWTQSDLLIPGEKFDALAGEEAPSLLHIHPFLFGGEEDARGNVKAGIQTFGMRHFIGREITIEPNILPWAANFEVIMTFLRVAIAENGYVIPHTDTFGPDDHSLSYRVLHHEEKEGEVPRYELIPLLYREFDFVADDYVPRENLINDQAPPLDVMPEDDEDKMDLVNEWREKRAMAEGIGGSFEVRSRTPSSAPPPSSPASSGMGFGRRVAFGRKGL